MTKPLCQHCGQHPVNRPRGLCWTCYYTPGVKEKYPVTSKFCRRGFGNGIGTAPLAERATDAEPGSERKIQVLRERARRGESLFHPDDLGGDGDHGAPLGSRVYPVHVSEAFRRHMTEISPLMDGFFPKSED